jgi:hypothetical protein
MHAVGTRTVAAAIAMTLLVCVVAIAGREPPRATSGPPAEAGQAPDDVKREVPPARGPLPPEVFVFVPDEEFSVPAWLPWTIAGFVLTALVTGGLLHVRGHRLWGAGRRRRTRRTALAASEPPGASTDDNGEVARRAVEAALEPLRDPAHPRGAVIAAYARMERVLAERELGRRTPEAPREYLARVLHEQGMPERSLTTLTALFEEARFSLHPIPQAAPRRALRELENARIVLAAMDEHN